jgi:hypothetical protein
MPSVSQNGNHNERKCILHFMRECSRFNLKTGKYALTFPDLGGELLRAEKRIFFWLRIANECSFVPIK